MTLSAGDSKQSERIAASKKICYGLQSDDRRVRKQSFIDLQNLLSIPNEEFSPGELRNIFNETHVYTLNGLRDKVENVREQAIKFVQFLIIDKLPLNDFYLTYVFPVLVERIGSVEVIEESEEIRLQLVELLNAIILKYSRTEQLKPFLNDSVIVLCETVKDKHPAIKELSCKCIVDLAEALPRDFHMGAESFVKPVLTCFTHQRYKVRLEAIKCIGTVVMESTYKALEQVLVPLAEKLFDQIPVVRRTVAQVAARWMQQYRDRYSFFHKILPLLLTGLNDEVQETRDEAHQLWEKVGLQYEQENEKDLKDQMDFLIAPPKYYLEHLQRPNLGCRVLVQRNIGKLANALSKELSSWQADIRVRCSQLLCAVALHAEEHFTMHMQDLLPAMFSAARDQDPRVVMNIVRAGEIIGLFVPFETWNKLADPQIDDSAHFGHIMVVRSLVTGAPKELIWEHVGQIAKLLAQDHICYSRKKRFQVEMVKCAEALCDKFNSEDTSDAGYDIFKISVVMVALRDKDNEHITIDSLDRIYKALDLNSRYDLWHLYTSRLLDHVNKDPKSWTAVTPERCIFETILVESGEAFGENLPLISSILRDALDVEADAESRLKTFLALTTAFERQNVIFKNADDLSGFFRELILDVFVPSLVWHAGRTAEAMRTMAATCLQTALTPTEGVDPFTDGETLRPLIDKLTPLLISLMEDAAYKSRALAMECAVLLKLSAEGKGIWTIDDFIKIYPEVLKRLDDPTEKVRECCIKVLPKILFPCPEEFTKLTYKAHHELIIDTLLTHFDDEEEHIQELIFAVLKVMAKLNKDTLEKKVNRHKPLVRNKQGCEKILEYLEECA